LLRRSRDTPTARSGMRRRCDRLQPRGTLECNATAFHGFAANSSASCSSRHATNSSDATCSL
jgi:hypothetical protein